MEQKQKNNKIGKQIRQKLECKNETLEQTSDLAVLGEM